MAGRAPLLLRELPETLRALGARARRTLWVGGIALGVGLACTAVGVMGTKRLYRSEAVIQYERGVLPAEPESPRQMGARLEAALTSPERLQPLIEELRLYPTVAQQRGLAGAVDLMRAQLEVTARDGYSFGVSYDADDADRARAVLARLVASVIDEDARQRRQQAQAATLPLEAERRRDDQDLKTKEARLAAFLAEHPQLAPDSSAASADSADSPPEVAALEQRAAEIEQQIAEASQPPASAATQRPVDPALVAARDQTAADLLTAERELNDKQTRLPYEHPDIKLAQRDVDDAREALRRAEAAVAASATLPANPGAPKAGASERVATLRRELTAVRSRVAALRPPAVPRQPAPKTAPVTAEVDAAWARLAQDVSQARERRSQLDAKLFQAQLLTMLVSARQGGGLTVSDPSSRPITSGRLRVAVIGCAWSMLLALLTLIAAALLDRRLYAPQDVARVLGPDVVVVVPRLGVNWVGRLAAKATDGGA
jgi:hypothetical protein